MGERALGAADHSLATMQRLKEMLSSGGRVQANRVRRSSVLPEDQEQEVIDREMFANLWAQRKLLPPTKSPHATFRRKWFKLLLVLMLYEMVYIPMQLSFQIPRKNGGSRHFQLPWIQVLLQYAIDCCFWADMVMEFRTVLVGPPEQGSILITDLKVIAANYRKGRFKLDLFSVLPLDIFCIAAPEGGLRSLAAQYFRLNRMFHIFRVVTVHGSAIAKLPRVSGHTRQGGVAPHRSFVCVVAAALACARPCARRAGRSSERRVSCARAPSSRHAHSPRCPPRLRRPRPPCAARSHHRARTQPAAPRPPLSADTCTA